MAYRHAHAVAVAGQAHASRTPKCCACFTCIEPARLGAGIYVIRRLSTTINCGASYLSPDRPTGVTRMGIILGIDTGLQHRNPTGYAMLVNGTDPPGYAGSGVLVPSAKADVLERIRWLGEEVDTKVRMLKRGEGLYAFDAIAVELPWHRMGPRGNIQTTIHLAMLVGAIMMVASEHMVPFFGITPSEGKLALVGDGKADKQAMIWAVTARYGIEVGEHEADAVGVAQAAWAKLKLKSAANGGQEVAAGAVPHVV
jgi:Holliday junction resolvasome RuvABC endonuclease subunit